jgi:hypothetical protein
MSLPSVKYEQCDLAPGVKMRNFERAPVTDMKHRTRRLAVLVRLLRRAI